MVHAVWVLCVVVGVAAASPPWPQPDRDSQGSGLMPKWPLHEPRSFHIPLLTHSAAYTSPFLSLGEPNKVYAFGYRSFQHPVLYAMDTSHKPPLILWSLDLGSDYSEALGSSSIIVGSKLLYIAMPTYLPYSGCCHNVLAIDVRNGQIVWNTQSNTALGNSNVFSPILSQDENTLYTLCQLLDIQYAAFTPDSVCGWDAHTGALLWNLTLVNTTSLVNYCTEGKYLSDLRLGPKGDLWAYCAFALFRVLPPQTSDQTTGPKIAWIRHGNPATGPDGPYWDNATQPYTLVGTPRFSPDGQLVYVPSHRYLSLDSGSNHMPGLACFFTSNGSELANFLPTYTSTYTPWVYGAAAVGSDGTVFYTTEADNCTEYSFPLGVVAFEPDLKSRKWAYCLMSDANEDTPLMPNFFKNGDLLISEYTIHHQYVTRLDAKTGHIKYRVIYDTATMCSPFAIDSSDTAYFIGGTGDSCLGPWGIYAETWG